MFKSYTKLYSDESTEGAFCFTFYCDICRQPFRVAPLAFSESPPPDNACEQELWELKWQKEHAQAFERANYAAACHFFHCPVCGKYVCEQCTLHSKQEGDLRRERCTACGTPAYPDGEQPQIRFVYEPPTVPEQPKKKRWWKFWLPVDSPV